MTTSEASQYVDLPNLPAISQGPNVRFCHVRPSHPSRQSDNYKEPRVLCLSCADETRAFVFPQLDRKDFVKLMLDAEASETEVSGASLEMTPDDAAAPPQHVTRDVIDPGRIIKKMSLPVR